MNADKQATGQSYFENKLFCFLEEGGVQKFYAYEQLSQKYQDEYWDNRIYAIEEIFRHYLAERTSASYFLTSRSQSAPVGTPCISQYISQTAEKGRVLISSIIARREV